MPLADGCEQEVQVAGDVGERTHRGTRIAGDGLLLDGNHRREAVDEIHVRLFHLGDEALGVGGERLHIAPLAFRVHRVEGQRRLAGAGEPGDDGELIPRNLHGDVFQVVNPCALHGDGCSQLPALRGFGRLGIGRPCLLRARCGLRFRRARHSSCAYQRTWKNASSSTSA